MKDFLQSVKEHLQRNWWPMARTCSIFASPSWAKTKKATSLPILEKVATRVPAPILVDSTEADVVEEALTRIPAGEGRRLWISDFFARNPAAKYFVV